MAYGDVGGAVKELVITCQCIGPLIRKGDAVRLVGNYEVSISEFGYPIFGQALSDALTDALPIMVRGIAVFTYEYNQPIVDGVAGIKAGGEWGKVAAPLEGQGQGINVKVGTNPRQVHVLL